MNDAKYIGLDVHQATISVAVLDSAGQLAMEANPGNEGRNDSPVYSWPARKFACDLVGRNLRGVVARPAQAACRCSSGV
jgi:hypothetical protein